MRLQLKEYRRSKQWKQALQIKNGMIVSIGIGEYGSRPHDSEIPGYLTNLSVGADVENLRNLSGYLRYQFVTAEGKLSWTKDEVMDFLQEEIGAQFFDPNGVAKHDGLIVSISSHGLQDCVISSDYELINRTDIHRCISEKYPQIREIPRIFMFDACNGTRDRIATTALHSDDSEEARKGGNDVLDALQKETEWTSMNKNPDYNLVEVHGSNDGFVSKMQATTMGSYLTHSFVKAVRQRIEKKQRKGLSDMLKDIQNALHDKGKQLIKFTCYNDTGNMRIERARREGSAYKPPTLELMNTK